ncbi:hypothetical protein [Nonomuraea aridisoli]|uniref:PPM-type phosphatase domain-containing protein n=1 Tax=Nonomuraea aridisoli TaxID=2070368 RepID=A0A2W2E1S8_9ACTN|nr:hypothetical protein [Nonomuraea aridisoli]PZG10569.1 hypothetical protein C1J01_35995 [Nonomuraea aridisoli]
MGGDWHDAFALPDGATVLARVERCDGGHELYHSTAGHPPPLLVGADGLVERPGEHLDKGFDRLRERVAAQCRTPLDRLCDDLLSFLPRHTDDDVAMIGLGFPAAPRRAEPVRPQVRSDRRAIRAEWGNREGL